MTSLSKETIGSTESEIMRNTVKIPIIGARAQPLGPAPLVKIGRLGFCCAFPPVVQLPVSKFPLRYVQVSGISFRGVDSREPTK